jgi:hypothetical protein
MTGLPDGTAAVPWTPLLEHRPGVRLEAVVAYANHVAVGLRDFGKPDGYVSRQITGWIDRYAKSQTDDVLAMKRVGARHLSMPR